MRKILVLAILMFMVANSFSQQVKPYIFVTATGSGQSNDQTINYVIGETFIYTLRAPEETYSLIQGFSPGTGIFVSAIPVEPGKVMTDFSGWIIYPNPFRESLTISPRSLSSGEVVHISVVDVIGNLVYQQNNCNLINGGYFELNLTELGRGTYFLRIQKDGADAGSEIFKLVKLN